MHARLLPSFRGAIADLISDRHEPSSWFFRGNGDPNTEFKFFWCDLDESARGFVMEILHRKKLHAETDENEPMYKELTRASRALWAKKLVDELKRLEALLAHEQNTPEQKASCEKNIATLCRLIRALRKKP